MDFVTQFVCAFMSCHQPAPVPVTYQQAVYRTEVDNALRGGNISPNDPIIRDCAHVAFPQCSGGN